MHTIERVREYLQDRNPDLNIIVLEENTSTAPLAAHALGLEVGQIAKSILFKTKGDDYLMVVAAGDTRLDSRAIKSAVGSKVRMASSEEVLEVTGFCTGGVCPFALKRQVPIYLDQSLLRFDKVYAAAGTANTALPITYQELMEITGGIACCFSERGAGVQ
jgi:Cys-tRNA(Pro) deacylase